MSQSFNPYRKWLGIESVSETPSYYELLGLRPLESDAGKINAAYQRQSGRLAAEFSGSQAELAQRLASELAEARMTLLTPTAKRAYDQAIATRGASAPANTVAAQPSPVAVPQASANPVPISAAQPFVPQPAPQPAAPYAAQPYAAMPGYPSAGYGSAQPYPAAPAYPTAQAYPAWQAQQPVAYPTGVGQQPAAGYYGAPAAGYSEAAGPIQPEADALPAVRRRRPARRRSSALPVLVVVAVCALGGLGYYVKSTKTVAVLGLPPEIEQSKGNSRRLAEETPEMRRQSEPPAREKVDRDSSNTPPKEVPPPAISDSGSMPEPPPTEGDMPAPPADRPDSVKPLPDNNKPQPDKSQPDKPEPEKPQPVNPNDEPKPTETKASAEESAAVGKVLKSARTALANREIAKAQDLLAEATIEASSPDMLKEVSRVETLASYVEMFWEAVRNTLPKIELEEIDLDGTMIVVVEADENHLIVRAEGRNREYTWQKIPTKIAYYLADRWLTRDDPVRNLVLGAFEIVDPKGDRSRAQSLLDAASAAKLNARPLLEELKAARGN
jgi:curved DNA-binding protein CbpA